MVRGTAEILSRGTGSARPDLDGGEIALHLQSPSKETSMHRAASLIFCLALLAHAPAVAQDAAVANYQLSMDKMRKLVEVQRSLNAAIQKNPELFAAVNQETDAATDKNGGPLSATQRIAIVERHPEFKSLFTSAGWTARDWILAS